MKALLLVLLLAASVAEAAPLALRVMSFNMQCPLCGRSDYGSWAEREEGLIKTLRTARPDLLSSQELMFDSNLETVRRALPNLEPHYVNPGLPWLDVVVWIDRQRFEVLEEGHFWLGPSPDSTLGFGWTWSVPRVLLWLHLRDHASGVEFTVAGTHLDNNRGNKPHAVALLRERLPRLGPRPFILAGDFNLQATSPLLAELTRAAPPALIDSFDLARDVETLGAGPGPVERGCKDFLSQPFPACRIDHVLVDRASGWTAARHTVDLRRLGPGGNFVSDHRAVWVELELTTRP